MEWIFWIGILGVSYSYLIYPLVLLLLPKQRVLRAAKNDAQLPTVTLIITAHNEARRMHEKLVNTLTIDYSPDKLEILVASDASTDETDTIVRSFAAQGVRLVRAEVRKGKEYAQSLAIKEASGEILVFSDVGTDIPPTSIRLLVENFADSRVGAVSSEDRFISQDGKIAGEGLYVKYEMWLRRLESAVNTLVGLSGSFFAVRREICDDWDISIPSDFNTALNCISKGYIAVTDPRVLGFYQDIKDSKKEYERKVRTVIRGISAVASQPRVLNPLKVGFFAFQVWSHKLMRWAVPWFLALVLFSNLFLVLASQSWFYASVLVIQMLAYTVGLMGYSFDRLRDQVVVRIPYFFFQVNLAIIHATLAFLAGKKVTIWNPSTR